MTDSFDHTFHLCLCSHIIIFFYPPNFSQSNLICLLWEVISWQVQLHLQRFTQARWKEQPFHGQGDDSAKAKRFTEKYMYWDTSDKSWPELTRDPSERLCLIEPSSVGPLTEPPLLWITPFIFLIHSILSAILSAFNIMALWPANVK